MKNLKRFITGALLIGTVGIFAGCGNGSSKQTAIKLGVNGTDFTVWNYVKDELAKEDIALEVISFSDYIQPNIALAEGEIDINAFQTELYFQNFISDHNLDLVKSGYTVIAPMSIFSEKVSSLDELPEGATIAIPNDATNGGRALNILQEAGLIKLADGVGTTPTDKDIIENPKNIEVISVDATIIPRSLPDIELGIINSTIAITAGLNPLTDAIYIEDINHENAQNYYNIFAIRSGDEDRGELKRLVEIYQTEPVKALIEEVYGGAQTPLF